MLVAGGQPDYRCQVPTGALINDTLPAADNGSSAKCEVDVGNNETERCTDWEYYGDIGHTIVSQVSKEHLRSRDDEVVYSGCRIKAGYRYGP